MKALYFSTDPSKLIAMADGRPFCRHHPAGQYSRPTFITSCPEYGILGNESNWKRFQLGGRWIPGWPRACDQGNHFSDVQEHFYQIRLPAFTEFVRTYLGGGQNQEWGRYLRQPAQLECVELSEKKAASKSREPRLTYMTWQLWRKLNQPTGRLTSARNYSVDSVLQNPWYRSLVRLFVCVKLLLVKCQSLWWMSQDPPIGIRRLLVCLLFEMLLVAVLHPVPYTPMQTWYLSKNLHRQIFRLKVLHHKSA